MMDIAAKREVRRCPHCGRFGFADAEGGFYAPMIGNRIVETMTEGAEMRIFCNERCFTVHTMKEDE